MNTFPETDIPVLITGDVVVFPGSSLNLLVQNERSIAAARAAQSAGGWVLALAQREADEFGTADSLYRTGVIGKIDEITAAKSGGLNLVLSAEERFRTEVLSERTTHLVASGAIVHDKQDADPDTFNSLRDSLHSTAIEILDLLPIDTTKLAREIKQVTEPRELSHFAAQYLNLSTREGQEILEMVSLKNRLLKLLELLVGRREKLKVQFKIRETISESVGKRQREAILREQLKAIQDELGDKDSEAASPEDYRSRVTAAGMPEEVSKVALREVTRLERMGDQAAESHVIRNYLDLLCEMPWNKTSEGVIDLIKAEAVLERDHYGLKKIKSRILEHLAVLKLRPEKRGSIILFIGPPGVGKTSLGKSVAEALGREFVRVSLGGVRDDADIRGHRRTYIGALPGRIVDGIRRAKTKDPVFVLDEIDKLARGWGGDPSSALLEVLDPAQNGTFHDHYLDVPFDLSQVVFIATANSRDSIPGPLLDRMEVIELSGYTSDEKFHIGKNHLLPVELIEHGLDAERVHVEDAAIGKIIEGYTREAGVRSLRRELAKVIRAAAARVAREEALPIVISDTSLTEILGPIRFEMEEMGGAHDAGVVTGMAWTPVGGDVLYVEAADIPGSGKVAVTGQLGDVMKESSQIAVALARRKLEGIAPNVLYSNRDIHLHVPGGAVPKDGPSAGVTMFAAVASMMLGVPVNPKLAMTGEITLRGKVLPVGGIKEKVLAAARFGVKEIILPARNARDIAEIPDDVRKALEFHLVSDIDELLLRVFGPLAPAGARKTQESMPIEGVGGTVPFAGPQLHQGM